VTSQAAPGGLPRHVALVLGTSAGGIASHVGMLARGLAALDVPVSILGPDAMALRRMLGEASTARLPGRPAATVLTPGGGLAVVDIGSRPRPRDARTAWRLRRLLAGTGADVVHAHGVRAGALCAIALAGRQRTGLVVTIHNAPAPGRQLRTLAYRLLEAVVARGASQVLCVSPDLEDRMRRAGARQVTRAVVAARDTPPLPRSMSSPLVAADAAGGRPIVLAVGRLAPQKGLGTLLAAAACWRDMDPVPRVVIAGDGPLLASLRAQAAALGVDAEFLGHRGDVPELLAVCDVLVMPSRWEGQPLVLQEALRAGAAIVATRAGGIPALVGQEAACLVPPGDAAELAAAVRAVLLDQPLAARLRDGARRRARSLPAERDGTEAALAAYARARRPGHAR
jgi:glycosyltransferase involved in cell wall biosynthesis